MRRPSLPINGMFRCAPLTGSALTRTAISAPSTPVCGAMEFSNSLRRSGEATCAWIGGASGMDVAAPLVGLGRGSVSVRRTRSDAAAGRFRRGGFRESPAAGGCRITFAAAAGCAVANLSRSPDGSNRFAHATRRRKQFESKVDIAVDRPINHTAFTQLLRIEFQSLRLWPVFNPQHGMAGIAR